MKQARTTNVLLSIIAVIAVGVVLKLMQPVLILLLVALMVTYLFDPVLVVMRTHLRLPLWAAVSLTGILALAVLSGVGAIVTTSLVEFTRDFDPVFVAAAVGDTLVEVERFIGEEIAIEIEEELGGTLGNLTSVAQSVLNGISYFVVAFFFALLFLAAKHTVAHRANGAEPNPSGGAAPGILQSIDRSFRRFIVVRTLISLLVATATTLILLAFGVRFAVVWGLLTFLLNFIPTIGSLAAVAVVTLFSVVQFGIGLEAGAVAVCLTAAQLLTGSVLEPKLQSSALALSLPVIFVALLFWGWLWGPFGGLLAVPMTAALRIVLANIPSTAAFARFLGGQPASSNVRTDR